MGKDKKDKKDKEKDQEKENSQELAKSIGDELRRGELDSNELEVVEACKITRFYRVPSARFRTADDIVRYYGYRIGDKVGVGQVAMGNSLQVTPSFNKLIFCISWPRVDLEKFTIPLTQRLASWLPASRWT